MIETFFPALQRLQIGERFVPFEVRDGYAGIDEYDVVGQRLVSHHCAAGDDASEHRSTHRYAFPAEYDLMARIAGLRLRERWADWHRNPFTATSPSHVSVYEPTG